MREFNIKAESVVTDKDIADWVTTAFEGGMTYWCNSVECMERDLKGRWSVISPERYESFQIDGVGPYANPEFWDNDKRGYRIVDDAGEAVEKVLTLAGLLKATQYQPKQVKGQSNNWFRKVIDRFLSEDYDADDADILVQIAVFGEVVYG